MIKKVRIWSINIVLDEWKNNKITCFISFFLLTSVVVIFLYVNEKLSRCVFDCVSQNKSRMKTVNNTPCWYRFSVYFLFFYMIILYSYWFCFFFLLHSFGNIWNKICWKILVESINIHRFNFSKILVCLLLCLSICFYDQQC